MKKRSKTKAPKGAKSLHKVAVKAHKVKAHKVKAHTVKAHKRTIFS